MIEWFWRRVARFLARPKVADAIIRFAGRHPYTDIYDADDSLYMARGWLLPEMVTTLFDRKQIWFPYAARVHYIAREDRDRDKHDHPYDYRTIGLCNGYNEEDLFGVLRKFRAGDTMSRRAQHFHKIVFVKPLTFTLFIYRVRAVSNPWGFLVPSEPSVRKIGWRDYIATTGQQEPRKRENHCGNG